ncbi:MAG: hypothetical protein AAFQ40_09870 [Cyanobacteria bacterium J06623_5]
MYKVSLRDAKNQLAQLLELAAKGQTVVIVREDGTAFRLALADSTATPPTPSTNKANPAPSKAQPSSQKRGVSQSADFDAQRFMQELEDAYKEQSDQQPLQKRNTDWDTNIEKYFSDD